MRPQNLKLNFFNMEESKILESNMGQSPPKPKKAIDFCIGFFGIILFIFIIQGILYYLPIDAPVIPLVLAPIIVFILLEHFFKHRRWIFWGMLVALISGGGVFVYFLSQIRFD